MNIGKALFAQVMDFLPWSTFTRIVARYSRRVDIAGITVHGDERWIGNHRAMIVQVGIGSLPKARVTVFVGNAWRMLTLQ
jgi:hypothetical protein